MSSQADEQPIWTPPVIITIVCRIVMICVSIGFIWKKYRRTTRQIDEEQAVGSPLATRNNSPPRRSSAQKRSRGCPPPVPNRKPIHHRHRISNAPSQQSRPLYVRCPTLREVLSAHIEDIIQSSLSIDNDDDLEIDVPQLSFNGSQIELSIDAVDVSSPDNVGLDVEVGEVGDIGLRHRSADYMSEQKNDSRCENLNQHL